MLVVSGSVSLFIVLTNPSLCTYIMYVRIVYVHGEQLTLLHRELHNIYFIGASLRNKGQQLTYVVSALQLKISTNVCFTLLNYFFVVAMTKKVFLIGKQMSQMSPLSAE